MKKVLKRFNEEITIKISVDVIAEQLLSMFNKDEKHAIAVTESIIGNAMRDTTMISQIYNSLNGYSNDIEFEPGDRIICDKTAYLWVNKGTVEEPNWKACEGKIGFCMVTQVDIHRDDKLEIEYNIGTAKGAMNLQKIWVYHTTCNKLDMNEMP